MKTRKTPILANLRLVLASTFLLAAVGLASVALTTTNLVSKNDTDAAKPAFHGINQSAIDGVEARNESRFKSTLGAQEQEQALPNLGPDTRAVEEFNKRAYPADDIPVNVASDELASITDFMNAAFNPTPAPTATATATPAGTSTPIETATPKGKKKKGGKRGGITAPAPAAPAPPTTITVSSPPEPTPTPYPVWSLYGPSTATFPDVLTFAGQSYITSGRITALAAGTVCVPGDCRLWVGAAGGGIWRTDDAISGPPINWTFLTSFVQSNAIGTITFDAPHNALYVGTGEPNASGDSAAGAGIWRSLDGGNTWVPLGAQVTNLTTTSPGSGPNGTYTGNAFLGRSIASIVIDPTNPLIMYVSSTRGVRGISSVTGGATSNPPLTRPPFGLFKSVDGGGHFSFIWDGGSDCPAQGPVFCNGTSSDASLRGVTDVKLDPSNHNIVYAATYPSPNSSGGGIWRSTDAGVHWTQIIGPRNAADNSDRAAFDVINLGGGNTRMYANIGNSGAPVSHVFRSDNVNTTAAFTDLTLAEVPAGQSSNVCTGQCWYDNFVRTVPGAPNNVYVGGSYVYNECGGKSDCRAFIFSNTAGATWFDFTWDGNLGVTPVGQCCQPNPVSQGQMHPDMHAFALNPSNPNIWFEGSDGGLVRGGRTGYSNISGLCAARGLAGADLLLCQQLLSVVPTNIESLNEGLSTLQFQSVSVANNNSFHVQGGTQDNGTFETFGSLSWPQIIYGDGGQSGFKMDNSTWRFNTFTGQANDGNFQNGDPTKWVEITGPILFSVEASQFYPAIIADPTSSFSGSIFQGSRHVWRSQDWGGATTIGIPALEAFCAEFGPYSPFCGDFEPLGGPSAADCSGVFPPFGINCLNTGGDLGGTVYGTDRRPTSASRIISAIARTTSNTNTAWAATSGGRVFISDNINTATPSAVVWNRVDSSTSGLSPSRFPTSIAIDPNNVRHAWISYSGYDFNTPTTPGHIFSVTWSGAGAATWLDISGNLPKIPTNAVIFDPFTGDLFAANDFIVLRKPAGSPTWFPAGSGMPFVEVSGLTMAPNAHILYAATHGRSVWQLFLP